LALRQNFLAFLGLELETHAFLQDVLFPLTVGCKFSAEDNKPLYNSSYAQK